MEKGRKLSTRQRVELLKGYLKRLGKGEDLESVRADFVVAFQGVDATEIMQAEQEMLQEGTKVSEIQKLCDLHSALFHGKTWQEQLMEERKALGVGFSREERIKKTEKLLKEEGHPLNTFAKENKGLSDLLTKAKQEISQGKITKETFGKIHELAVHYAKKGDLLYPHLKVKYKVSGPSDVMWTTDDEIRDELSWLSKKQVQDETWMKKFEGVLKRIDEMIYKEQNILFPNCAVNFTKEEWIGIYHDAKDYPDCLGVKQPVWEIAEKEKNMVETSKEDLEIYMAGGHMSVAQLTAVLNTIPMEITFVDADNINRFFNEGSKDFKRPGMAIDREVFSCHPPKIEAQVRGIIEEFRKGNLDEVPIWMEKNKKTVLVKYMAVRDKEKNYLGTLELVQDMDFAREHFLKEK